MARPSRSSTTPGAKRASKPKPKAAISSDTPLVEWIAAAVGLILVIATLGLIGAEVVRADHTPPRFSVRALDVVTVPGGYLMRVRVDNGGGSPAASVAVEGRLTPPKGEPEVAEVTFDFVAEHSSREGGLYFASDPRQGSVDLRAKSYTDP